MNITTKDNFKLEPNTFLLVNKPEGWTSFDVVGYLRKMFRQQNPELKKIRVGHAGTLDPFATGLLIVAIGREATREIENFKNLSKVYIADIKLGEVSNTGDKTGNIEPYKPKKILNIKYWILNLFSDNIQYSLFNISKKVPTKIEIKKIFVKFLGPQYQTPPMFSAKKIDGQRLYKLARLGKKIKRKANKIEIFDLQILDYQYPVLKITVTCSPGTYIRTLAEDIGKKLNTGAYCQELKRTKIGDYDLKDAMCLTSVLRPQATKN